MSDIMPGQRKSVVVLGASFSTGNLGVSALAWSTLKLIRSKWPDASITLLGVGREYGVAEANINGQVEKFPTWPVRYCPNVMARHHILGLWVQVAALRLLPFLRERSTRTASVREQLLECDLICDITGGDSFSDIYGLSRLFRGYMLKRLCQMTGKPFVLLPQTYGPFNSFLAKVLARRIFKKSQTIYSRDQEGRAVVKKMIGSLQKVRLYPDVAFLLDPVRPDTSQASYLEQLVLQGKRLIGLNISGLLYNGGYTRENMFGLADDYPSLVRDIISFFVKQYEHHVLLVPHVLPSSNLAVEDDYLATCKALKDLPADIQDKVIVVERGYDQNEIKYIIGLCDFFLGSRMHATIAAISQGITAVGLAYSRKFSGVFDTAGVGDCVLDLRTLKNNQVLDGVMDIYRRRDASKLVLENTVPKLKEQLFHIFDNLQESVVK